MGRFSKLENLIIELVNEYDSNGYILTESLLQITCNKINKLKESEQNNNSRVEAKDNV